MKRREIPGLTWDNDNLKKTPELSTSSFPPLRRAAVKATEVNCGLAVATAVDAHAILSLFFENRFLNIQQK